MNISSIKDLPILLYNIHQRIHRLEILKLAFPPSLSTEITNITPEINSSEQLYT